MVASTTTSAQCIPDRNLERKGRFDVQTALKELDSFADGVDYVLGHNLLGHDLPVIESLATNLNLLQNPVVDTLYLSPPWVLNLD